MRPDEKALRDQLSLIDELLARGEYVVPVEATKDIDSFLAYHNGKQHVERVYRIVDATPLREYRDELRFALGIDSYFPVMPNGHAAPLATIIKELSTNPQLYKESK